METNNNELVATNRTPGMTRKDRRAVCREQLSKAMAETFTVSNAPRHYRTIVRELGARGITLSDINKESKARGLAEMLEMDLCTLDDLVVLGQYAKAIELCDTKAAEWIRDTAGYKPTLDITVEQKTDSLSTLSDEQLMKLLNALDEPALPTAPEDTNV